jgi:hypothetical protein
MPHVAKTFSFNVHISGVEKLNRKMRVGKEIPKWER